MVIHLDECESTQTEARKLALEGAPAGLVVVARKQTAGRGRQGRTWLSTEGALTFSMVLRPNPLTPRITLTAGVAVLEALDDLGVHAQLKWPNDIVLGGRKLGGVLTEAFNQTAIVGIGLNLATHPEGVNATSVDLPREDVLATLLRHLPGPEDFAYVLTTARKRSATLGREVTTSDGTQGLAVDLDPDGALLVETATCLVTVRAGELL